MKTSGPYEWYIPITWTKKQAMAVLNEKVIWTICEFMPGRLIFQVVDNETLSKHMQDYFTARRIEAFKV